MLDHLAAHWPPQSGKRPRRVPAIIGALAVLPLMLAAASWGSSAALASPGWSIQPTPSTGGVLNGVSCTSASACIAVGQANGAVLAERWDGTAWATQPAPSSGTLLGVSCLAATSCTAVGSVSGAPLAEQWAGGAWSVTLNQGAGLHGVTLRGVSCTSASACTAAGNYYRIWSCPGHNPPLCAAAQTLAEQWNGTAWSVQTTPDNGTTFDNRLYGVSCTSANACIAVGQGPGAVGQLTMRWDGTAWSILGIVEYPGPVSTLYGVSCTSATACTAVGLLTPGSASSPSVYVDRWDGTRWSEQSVPLPLGAGGATLYGVSCPAANACTAVGGYTTRSGVKAALAEAWNGATWTFVPTPTPGGATSSTLAGVSCSSASTCTAVGTYVNNSGAQETLAEAYAG